MAHSSIKPIWKYSWKPEGYGVETITLDTSAKTLGSILTLDHSFFRGKDFAASSGNNSLTVGYENQTLTGKEDIVLRLCDTRLSQLGDSSVFRAFEIVSKRAKTKDLVLKVNYIADAIDPEEFGQVLNQEADVVHKTVEATESLSSPKIIVSLAVLAKMQGDWGKIDNDAVEFAASTFKLANFNLIGGKLSLTDPLEISCNGEGKDKGIIRYNAESFLWEVWNVRAKKFTPMIISHESAGDIPPGAIPVISGDDPAAQSYVDWFRIEAKSKTLRVPNLETEGMTSTKDKTEIKKEFVIAGHTFRAMDETTLDIDNLIQIDRGSNTVKICGLSFDKDLLNLLQKVESKLSALEKKIEGNQ